MLLFGAVCNFLMISPWWALYCSSDLCVQKKKPPRVELNLTLMTKWVSYRFCWFWIEFGGIIRYLLLIEM